MSINHKKALYAFFWQYGERLLTQGVSFLVTVILARILTPTEYGIISVSIIFITVFEAFVTCGLGSALVQKKNCEIQDFDSVYSINIILSSILYLLIFILAPFFSSFFCNDLGLCSIIRLIAIRIIFAALNTIQIAYIQKQLLFKKLFYANFIGSVVSSVFGVLFALKGFGVYALVIQYLSSSIVTTIFLFIVIEWKPKFNLDISRLKPLFKFGWKIFAGGLSMVVFSELRSILIGKYYSPSMLAFYDRGRQFATLVYENINSSLGKVLYPILADMQEDLNAIKHYTSVSVKLMSFVLFPLLFILFGISDNLIEFLITTKWNQSSPFLKIACSTYLFALLSTILTNSINALGKSDIYLKVELVGIITSLISLFIALQYGVLYIALSVTLASCITLIMRIYYAGTLFNYKASNLIKDTYLSLLFSGLSLGGVYLTGDISDSPFINMILQIISGLSVYGFLSYLFNRIVLMRITELCLRQKK